MGPYIFAENSLIRKNVIAQWNPYKKYERVIKSEFIASSHQVTNIMNLSFVISSAESLNKVRRSGSSAIFFLLFLFYSL